MTIAAILDSIYSCLCEFRELVKVLESDVNMPNFDAMDEKTNILFFKFQHDLNMCLQEIKTLNDLFGQQQSMSTDSGVFKNDLLLAHQSSDRIDMIAHSLNICVEKLATGEGDDVYDVQRVLYVRLQGVMTMIGSYKMQLRDMIAAHFDNLVKQEATAKVHMAVEKMSGDILETISQMTTSTTPIVNANKLHVYVSQLENQIQSETHKIMSLKLENETMCNESTENKTKLFNCEQYIAIMQQQAKDTQIANTRQTDELNLTISQLSLENVHLRLEFSEPLRRPRTTPKKVFTISDLPANSDANVISDPRGFVRNASRPN